MRLPNSLLYLLCCAALGAGTAAAPPQALTVAFLHSPEARQAVATPEIAWLKDGRALLLSRPVAPAPALLEVLDPASQVRTTLVQAPAALAALRPLLGDKTPAELPFPDGVDASANRALYTLDGHLFLLTFNPCRAQRLTAGAAEATCAGFSPDGKLISFVRGNNLHVYDLATGKERQLTRDGSTTMLNGTLSWVYWEEVFGRKDAGYEWSEDSSSIAYFQSDESAVAVTQFDDFKPWRPRVIRQRYPKVGESNPAVRVGILHLADGTTTWADLTGIAHEYVVRSKWLPGGRRLALETLNRLQTELELVFVDAASGKATRVLKEKDPGWVNIGDDLQFLADGRHFLWSSERTGFKHLYLYTLDGVLERPLTSGNWALRASGGVAWVDQSVLAVDAAHGWVYFTALEKSAIEHHLYRVNLDGTGFQRLSREPGAIAWPSGPMAPTTSIATPAPRCSRPCACTAAMAVRC